MVVATLLTAYRSGPVFDLEYVRSNYQNAVTDEKLCKNLIEALSEKADNPIYLGYLGAFQAIWANHTMNPMAKMETFRKGKKNIEKAIAAEPNNVELRFIRLSLQKNCPEFLGYSSQIPEDTQFIKDNLHKVTAETLRQLCNTVIEK